MEKNIALHHSGLIQINAIELLLRMLYYKGVGLTILVLLPLKFMCGKFRVEESIHNDEIMSKFLPRAPQRKSLFDMQHRLNFREIFHKHAFTHYIGVNYL